MTDHIQTERDGAVLTIRMSRPEKKNALTDDMYRAMTASLGDARSDASVRVILITGAGGVFTSGNDLHAFVATPPSTFDSPVFHFLTAISGCEKPIVAGVAGLAIGIGTTMLLHCDLVVADPATRFSLPFINLGLVPEGASSLMLPRTLGHLRASELLLLGEMFDAATAERLGLINRVSEAGAYEADAVAWARALAAKAPEALRRSKALIRSETSGVAARMQEEAGHFAMQLQGPEFREAVAAFVQKRPPKFS
ncbi:MAG TPA: enoyl-CoA hydratase [Gemmatimonadaceae bacterium]|nr:enoyl-CoA hydratase [Gemmatimonadaceae bacterium]